MTKTIEIDFHLVLVEDLVMSGRRSAFHRAEILAPSRPARVLFKSLFFSSPAIIEMTIKQRSGAVAGSLIRCVKLTYLSEI